MHFQDCITLSWGKLSTRFNDFESSESFLKNVRRMGRGILGKAGYEAILISNVAWQTKSII